MLVVLEERAEGNLIQSCEVQIELPVMHATKNLSKRSYHYLASQVQRYQKKDSESAFKGGPLFCAVSTDLIINLICVDIVY